MKKLWAAVLAGSVALSIGSLACAQPLPPTPQPDPGARVAPQQPEQQSSAKKTKSGKKSKSGKQKKQKSKKATPPKS